MKISSSSSSSSSPPPPSSFHPALDQNGRHEEGEARRLPRRRHIGGKDIFFKPASCRIPQWLPPANTTSTHGPHFVSSQMVHVRHSRHHGESLSFCVQQINVASAIKPAANGCQPVYAFSDEKESRRSAYEDSKCNYAYHLLWSTLTSE